MAKLALKLKFEFVMLIIQICPEEKRTAFSSHLALLEPSSLFDIPFDTRDAALFVSAVILENICILTIRFDNFSLHFHRHHSSLAAGRILNLLINALKRVQTG